MPRPPRPSTAPASCGRSEEHTSELQSQSNFVCRIIDRKSTRLNSSHSQISYAVFCLKKKKQLTPYIYKYRTTTHGCKRPVTHSYRYSCEEYSTRFQVHG